MTPVGVPTYVTVLMELEKRLPFQKVYCIVHKSEVSYVLYGYIGGHGLKIDFFTVRDTNFRDRTDRCDSDIDGANDPRNGVRSIPNTSPCLHDASVSTVPRCASRIPYRLNPDNPPEPSSRAALQHRPLAPPFSIALQSTLQECK
jgi:hypothetical protein